MGGYQVLISLSFEIKEKEINLPEWDRVINSSMERLIHDLKLSIGNPDLKVNIVKPPSK